MPDNLTHELIPHPDEERPLAELRSEFRAQHLADLRSQYAGQHPVGWNMIGDPATARDHYTAEEWAKEMDRWLTEPVTQDFGLGAVPSGVGVQVQSLAQKAILHDSVTWDAGTEGTTDHDAPACDLAAMTDDQIADYVDSAIKDSERHG